METRSGVKGIVFDGIFFTESNVPGASSAGHIKAAISHQNSNLNEIKKNLASQARFRGATAIMNFKYGQRKTFFGWDTESWYGEGDAVRL